LSPAIGQRDTLYSEDGTVQEVGILRDGLKNGYWVSYYPDGELRSEGNFEDGYRVGQWRWYHENGKLCSIEKWRNGIYWKGQYWDSEGNQSDITEVLTHPEYPGGIEAFTNMIIENIKYPEKVLEEGVEGRVVLTFHITPSGKLVNPVVKKRAHPELDKEALRVIQLSDLWIPAEFHGVKTFSKYTFPITFALQ
jgi:TonB family protein